MATGIAGLSGTATASHSGDAKITLPPFQIAQDHPRFNATIRIDEAYMPDGGYIFICDPPNTAYEVSGRTLVRLPAGHFQNASVTVSEDPDKEVKVLATIAREKDGDKPYDASDAGTVRF